MKGRAERNRTITLTEEEKKKYLALCRDMRETDEGGAADMEDRILLGDAFRILPCLPEGSVDLLIVDPPYNLNKKYGDHSFRSMDAGHYRAFTEDWIRLVKPLLKEDASVYVCCDWKTSLIVGPLIEENFCLRSRITWEREKGRGSRSNWKNSMEDIWYGTVSEKNYKFRADRVRLRRRVLAPYRENGRPKDWVETPDGNYRDTQPSNFWSDIAVPFWSMPENTDHPAQKPEKLLAKLILASSDPGDLVLDPFLGSGSTAAAAKKLGRRFCGIEREEEYCALAQKRLEMAEEDARIQGFEDGVFWERNTAARRSASARCGKTGKKKKEENK